MPVISPVTNFQNIRFGGNSLKPHILGCYPPDSMKHLVPVSVSLMETKCPKSKPSNNIQVYFDRHKSGHKQGIAVCSKTLSHLRDVSMRFIEWIELLRAQGVDKIILSVLAVHPNVNKVSFPMLVLGEFQIPHRLKATLQWLLPTVNKNTICIVFYHKQSQLVFNFGTGTGIVRDLRLGLEINRLN